MKFFFCFMSRHMRKKKKKDIPCAVHIQLFVSCVCVQCLHLCWVFFYLLFISVVCRFSVFSLYIFFLSSCFCRMLFFASLLLHVYNVVCTIYPCTIYIIFVVDIVWCLICFIIWEKRYFVQLHFSVKSFLHTLHTFVQCAHSK